MSLYTEYTSFSLAFHISISHTYLSIFLFIYFLYRQSGKTLKILTIMYLSDGPDGIVTKIYQELTRTC